MTLKLPTDKTPGQFWIFFDGRVSAGYGCRGCPQPLSPLEPKSSAVADFLGLVELENGKLEMPR